MAGFNVSPTLGLVLAGGRGDKYYTSTVEATTDGDQFHFLDPLPIPTECICLAVVDERTVMALGSVGDGPGKAFTYSKGERDLLELGSWIN